MLDLERVGFAYRPGSWVFRDVSLSVSAGAIVAVLGPNGRGKTTLLRLAAGLTRPQEGTVRAGQPVGFVPQAQGGVFAYRVIDMVLMGRARHIRAFSSPGRQDFEIATAALDRVGLGSLAERSFLELSGGERQLVHIARAVASGSEVLILDEPASALDLRNQGRILAMLRELADGGMGILLTTHHPDHALQIADDAVLMFGPDDVRVDTAARLLTEPVLSRMYEVPVRKLEYEHDGVTRQVLATGYAP